MSAPESGTPRIGPLRNLIASIGAAIIYALIRLFGRRVAPGDAPWLMGRLGGPHIGDKPFDEYAAGRWTGWFRRLVEDGRVLYTGFYTSQVIPSHTGACVKVVFPMPNGNATVILRPEVGEGGALILDSDGAGFGNVGFYRMQRFGRGDALTVWKIRSLKERFRVYLDSERVLRCDHAIRFLGLPVLHLHYRIQRKG